MSGAESKKRIQIYLMDGDARETVRITFEKLEQELKIEGIGTVITTAMLELIENAVKANLKRAFFSKHNYQLDNPASYQEGLKAFVDSYGSIHTDEFKQSLINLELIVSVDVNRDQHRLIIYVENNTLLLDREEERIRKQLAAAMKSQKLVDFYLQYGDRSEGSGLGLAMIVFLMRSIGFDPGNFRVFTLGKKTIARLEFPMDAQYIPIRDQFGDQDRNLP